MENQAAYPSQESNRRNFLFVKIDGDLHRICFKDIIYVEAVNKYVWIVAKSKKYLVSSTMTSIENVLPAELFCRIHRSYLVSIEHIERFNAEVVFINNKELPIGRQFKNSLTEKVIILICDNKKNNP